ncbi:MAG TPA: hypothetical protein VKU39_03625 [Streptosporangiaceae bacterium]|nr:hypothetical protein [Streptosporangiaceae bacterium]
MAARRRNIRLTVLGAAAALMAGAVAIAAPPVSATAARSEGLGGGGAAQRAAAGCDPIGVATCLIPFPDDYYAARDPGSLTGERIAFSASMLPASTAGVHLDPAPFNRADGFSPGSPVITVLPGADLAASHVASITDIGSSLAPGAPIVLLDTRTGHRVPYWAEPDSTDPDPVGRAILIHPAYRLADGTTYIVAIRNLATASGQPVAVPAGFQAMLGATAPAAQPLRTRWFQLRHVFRYLAEHGVMTQSLDQAWQFTTASSRDLTGQALHMRDEAFAALGGRAPAVTVTKVTSFTQARNPMVARIVDGYVAVPSYLNAPGGPPGSTLHFTSGQLYANPAQIPGNTQQAQFECVIPQGALAAAARNVLLFGHGLLQDQTIVSNHSIELEAAEHDEIVCGADWLGLSAQDVPTLIGLAQDLSRFSTVPDRMQQAYLDFLFLGRAMIRADGLAAQHAFRTAQGRPVIAASPRLQYAGYSLGGIQGSALATLAQDFTRAALYVPGSEFSLMIERSVDFAPFAALIAKTYPSRLDIQIGIALMQMLWDRGEPDGYVDHLLRDPLPGTPVKRVLIQEVFGDHQVPNIATETLVRTLGIPAYTPELQPGRGSDVLPFWGIGAIPDFPYHGSALFMWDSGSPRPPVANVPPTAGHDPHDDLSVTPAPQELGADFLLTGELLDVCGGTPCYALPDG